MKNDVIHPARIQHLNSKPLINGQYVLYWMQASQRVLDNHALTYGISKANELKKPLVVFFGLTDSFPEANERHYVFMLEGLQEIAQDLNKMGITFVLQQISPPKGVLKLAEDACLMVCDRGYLNIQKTWRQTVAERIPCPCVQVETDVIVPVETTSEKEEYAAATIRPKIHNHLSDFLRQLQHVSPKIDALSITLDSLEVSDLTKMVHQLTIDHTVKKSRYFTGGTRQALRWYHTFLNEKLPYFAEERNDPSKQYLSQMSPYLHFGQISPLTLALKLKNVHHPSKESFLEELIVRRELSMNFVHYNAKYDSYQSLPEWCKHTLEQHKKDAREYAYSLDTLEHGHTHDPYWNAAQQEMMITGKMHGYMRMYWGKKIIEWTEDPETAFRSALYLNNKYELDGRDPNGFTGVAWFFGKHDRAWKERPIFGKIRYMNAKGLERKFPIQRYVQQIDKLMTSQ